MNRPYLVFFFLILSLFLTVCAPKNSPSPNLSGGSMKGYELYSWQQGGQWYFSVLIGTNRAKTLDEIQSPVTRLAGSDALLSVLKEIPSGQYLAGGFQAGQQLPPQEIISQVEQICAARGLVLTIASQP